MDYNPASGLYFNQTVASTNDLPLTDCIESVRMVLPEGHMYIFNGKEWIQLATLNNTPHPVAPETPWEDSSNRILERMINHES
jgi:hypothetical protein